MSGKDHPAWSPDGDWIAYTRGWWIGGQLYTAIHKVPASGGAPVRVSDIIPNLWQHRITWNGDASLIYFEQMNQVSQAITGIPARVSARGGPTSLLTNQLGRDLVLSRNGRWLFYVGAARLGEPQQPQPIRVIDTLTGSDTIVLPGVDEFTQFEIAPNGAILGYWTLPGIRALSTGGISTLYAIPQGCIFVNWIWSPAGDRLGIWAQGCFSSQSELRWVRPFEGIGYPLTSVRPIGFPVWSSCGDYLAYGGYWTGLTSRSVGAVEVPSGRTTVICDNCFNGLWPSLTWSPFRDEVAWVNYIEATGTAELYKAPTGLPPTPAIVGTLVPGSRVTIRLKASADGNLPYVLGASFGTEPGLPTARGRIPLNLDPLLLASVSSRAPFHFFRSVLDSAGRAEAYLDLPALSALVGTRFFLGYVTLDAAQPAGIRTISGAVPVFVQPPG
jgi:hypothetical protein